jgi:hypothetical protein
MNRNIAAIVLVFFVVLVAVPAIACTANNYYSYAGTPCDWDGVNWHWDWNSETLDFAGASTGIQDGYSAWCDASRVKLYWKPYGGVNRLSYFYGDQGVTSGDQNHAEILYWSHHDVRSTATGTWYGWRLYHVCS